MNEKTHNIFYKTTNLVNGKFYYGIHSTDKLEDGYLGSGKLLKRAVKKHGTENFVREVIADYPTRKEASDREKLIVTPELIESSECYNLMTGGSNDFVLSEESRQLISMKNKGKQHTEEFKQLVSEKNRGRKHTDEAKLKIGIGNSKKPRSPELRAILSEHNKGKKHSPETRQKISEGNQGRTFSPETLQKMSDAQLGELNHRYGKTTSDEVRMKLHNSSPNKKSCMICGIEYPSLRQAGKLLKMPTETIRSRILSENIKFADWYYTDKDIKIDNP